MSHIAVSNLAYAHPGGELLFSEVSFRLSPGAHVGLVGANGVGKSTLMAVLAGRLAADEGEAAVGGRVGYMPQDVGVQGDERTVRELLLDPGAGGDATGRPGGRAPRGRAGRRGCTMPGWRWARAIADWSALGGYELEGQWDAACRRIVRAPLHELAERPAVTLSGGERKRLVLEVLFSSDAEVLLLDEPDNFLDVPAKLALERQIRAARKTVLMISHDREVLTAAVGSIVTLEGNGAWVHTAAPMRPIRRRARSASAGSATRSSAGTRRSAACRELMRTFKERARYSTDWAKKADAPETRWRRFRDAGPPPAPVTDRSIAVRIRGGDSARRVLDLRALGDRRLRGTVLRRDPLRRARRDDRARTARARAS